MNEILSLIEKGASRAEVAMKFKSGKRTISLSQNEPWKCDEGIVSILARELKAGTSIALRKNLERFSGSDIWVNNFVKQKIGRMDWPV